MTVCSTLEQGAAAALERLGCSPPDPVGLLDAEIARLITALSPARRRMVGLFSGGTLAYEAMIIASRHIGPVFSNTPLEEAWAAPGPVDGHVCLDLGEEEYTRGLPHPMIDPEARTDLLRRQASDPTVAVVLLDVVIGDGAHPDPAGVLAPAAAEVVASGAGRRGLRPGHRAGPAGIRESARCDASGGLHRGRHRRSSGPGRSRARQPRPRPRPPRLAEAERIGS